MARRASSGRWLERQRGDRYVKQRDREGYRSRAAYKLKDINRRDRLLAPGARVIDLGASPGGWTQVAVEEVGARGTVIALDILPMEPVAGATCITGDCRESAVAAAVAELVGARGVDLVMSDMAPNITGVAASDEAAALALAEIALDFARRFLRPGGALLMKLFQSADTRSVEDEIARSFGTLTRRKPDASRARSRELYVVAKRFGI